MKTITRAVACVAVLVGGLTVIAAAGQTTGPSTPPLVIESMDGPDLYRFCCATYQRPSLSSALFSGQAGGVTMWSNGRVGLASVRE